MEAEADDDEKRGRWSNRGGGGGEMGTNGDTAAIAEKQELWTRTIEEGHNFEDAPNAKKSTLMAHANALQHRGGLDFFALARGGERSYSTSFLINLDPDLLTLCAAEDQAAFDLYVNGLANHTRRIFKMVTHRSKREINQFCFGSTFVQLNPNYRKFDRMDPMTWKKEGIASHWTGVRGYRKKCCKVCCMDTTCNGCGVCRGCTGSPIRGNYDGLVVLAAITRESLPNYHTVITGATSQVRKNQEKHLDHENFAFNLETTLTSQFMYGGTEMTELQLKCVPSARQAIVLGDSIDEIRKQKKFSSYVVYVAYRLDTSISYTHNQKISRAISSSQAPHQQQLEALPEKNQMRNGGDVRASGGGAAAVGGAAATSGGRVDSGGVKNAGQRVTSGGKTAGAAGGGGVRSRDSSAGFKSNGFAAGGGSGAYDIEDIDDLEFGKTHGAASGAYDDLEADGFGGFAGFDDGPEDEEDEKLLEDLEDKQLRERISNLESENSNIKEQVWKLEHGRTWVENRLTALETDLQALKTGMPANARDTPAAESEAAGKPSS